MSIPFGSATAVPLATSPSGNEQAWAGVQLCDPSTASSVTQTTDCLVDTGAQYTVLPMTMFRSAGITPRGPLVSVRTVAGVVTSLPSHRCDLLIEGKYHIAATVLISSAVGFTPVLGLMELKDAFDFGFDFSNWYHD